MSTPIPPLQQALLALVPTDGSSIGNTALRKALGVPEADYWAAQAALVADGTAPLRGFSAARTVREPVAARCDRLPSPRTRLVTGDRPTGSR